MSRVCKAGRVSATTFMLAMVAGTIAIAHACLAYIEEGDMHPFILEKLPLDHERLWIGALYVHLVSAVVALPGCLALITSRFLRRAPSLHRWLGRGVGVVVLVGLVPSGSYLAFFARGGAASTVGFLLSGAIVAWAMAGAVTAARRRRFARHRRYAAHVLAQMSVAVTSRALLVAAAAAGLEGDATYVAALWVPVLASAAIAEWTCAPNKPRPARGSTHRPASGPRRDQ